MEAITRVLDRTLRREEIDKLLPHRGRMRLLDKVETTAERIIGEFTVTKEVCEGHNVFGGSSVFRGSDLYDMALILFPAPLSCLAKTAKVVSALPEAPSSSERVFK